MEHRRRVDQDLARREALSQVVAGDPRTPSWPQTCTMTIDPAEPQLELVLYSTSFCGACALTREHLVTATEAIGGGRVTWREVNVATDPDEAEANSIEATPTVVISRPGQGEVTRAAGVPTLDQLFRAIAAALPAG